MTDDIFDNIGQKPAVYSTDPAEKAAQTKALAEWNQQAAQIKSGDAAQKIAGLKAEIATEIVKADKQTTALNSGRDFDLAIILKGWYEPDVVEQALQQVLAQSTIVLTLSSAPKYGTMDDNTVREFINSKATKLAGDAKNRVARTLDKATGAARDIATDKTINVQNIEKEINKIKHTWENAKIMAAFFEQLHRKILNRVQSHQTVLFSVMEDLGGDSVLLDQVMAMIETRKQLILNSLYDTCVFGLSLKNMIATEKLKLADMERTMRGLSEEERGAWVNKVSAQKDLISIMTRRQIDLKILAVRQQAFFGVLSKTQGSVSAVQGDVEFSRTDLIAMLGITLNTIADIVSTVRASDAAEGVRKADADAQGNLNMNMSVLNEVTTRTLTNLSTAWDALLMAVDTQISAKQNSDKNFQLMLELVNDADAKLNTLQAKLGNA